MAGIFKDAAPLPSHRTGTVPITVVEPPGHARGGIIVLHEYVPHGLMWALAGEGWIAVAPRLELDGDDLLVAVDACIDWLTARGVFKDCVGVVGFDSAGAAAFQVAAQRPIGAAVSVSPHAPDSPAIASQLQAPWLGLFGADDPVDQFAAAVAAAPVATNVVRYLTASPDDLADAQTRVFDWLDSFLR